MKVTLFLVTSYLLGVSYARYKYDVESSSSYKHHAGSSSNYEYDFEYSCELKAFPPSPDSSCCGIDTTSTYSIVGGDKTGLKQYPWMALVEYKEYLEDELQQNCDGFLISGKYVVSAAHCFENKDSIPVNVVLGEYDTQHKGRDCVRVDGQRECTEGELRIAIEKVMVHENYDPVSYDHDIALIKLKKTVPYRDYIRPICLPTSDITVNPPEGLTLTSAGWGAMYQVPGPFKNSDWINKFPRIKRHVHLPYVSKKKCNETWDDVPENHLCAGGEEGKDVCMGDSGGPLMYDNDGTYEAVGIVSYGPAKPCGKKAVPGAYTNVYRYLNWIHAHIRFG